MSARRVLYLHCSPKRREWADGYVAGFEAARPGGARIRVVEITDWPEDRTQLTSSKAAIRIDRETNE